MRKWFVTGKSLYSVVNLSRIVTLNTALGRLTPVQDV